MLQSLPIEAISENGAKDFPPGENVACCVAPFTSLITGKVEVKQREYASE